MAKEKRKENIWNVPNALTMLRMALIPVFWVLMMNDQRYAALAVFAVASFTDILDGYIARKYCLVTDFGKLMDPLADKLMVVSMMLSLAIKGIAPWPALVILLVKEAIMVVGGVILLRVQVVTSAIWIGKLAQFLVVASLVACFFSDWFNNSVGVPVHLILLWTAVAFTLCALAVYTRRAISLYQEAKEAGNARKDEE